MPPPSEQKPSAATSIILHPLADLSSSYPAVFVCDLKQNFIHGKGKATAKFHAIRNQVIQALPSSPAPGPATFVIRCLEALMLIEAPYSEGLAHLLTSALNRVNVENRSCQDTALARKLASSLICSALKGEKNLDDRIIVKIIEVFNVQMMDVADALHIPDDDKIFQAEAFIKPLVVNLLKNHSYNGAMALIKHLHLQHYSSQEFLVSMVDEGNLHEAGRWASHLGKDMLCFLVQHCTNVGMFKEAYKYVQHYQLSSMFPEARHLCKRSSLPTVLVKGLWNRGACTSDEELFLSEHSRNVSLCSKTPGDTVELFNLSPPSCPESSKYVQINEIIPLENIVWVDSLKELDFAQRHLSGVSAVGIDCEWKAIRTKNCFINKVSVLQMATRDFVFVLDLINLSKRHSSALSSCIESVFSTPTILKLGYAVYNDLDQLLQSFCELKCFHKCESVLDLQLVAGKGIKGGLSGLAEVVLGKSMDKQMRMTDWERRPLTTKQLHYAALDAAVLLSIFDHIDSISVSETTHIDWKPHVDHFKAQKPYPASHDGIQASSQKAANIVMVTSSE